MDQHTKQFGQAATAAVKAMASPVLSTASTQPSPEETIRYLRSLPDALDNEQYRQVFRISVASPPALPPVAPKQFADALRKLSILPRRADDDTTGEERVKVYARLLGHYPADAIGFMVRQVLETCDWFPTPRQCLAILDRWTRNDDHVRAIRLAGDMIRSENERRWNDLCDRLSDAASGAAEFDQREIDALPDMVKVRLANRNLLTHTPPDGWHVRVRPPCAFLSEDTCHA